MVIPRPPKKPPVTASLRAHGSQNLLSQQACGLFYHLKIPKIQTIICFLGTLVLLGGPVTESKKSMLGELGFLRGEKVGDPHTCMEPLP